MQWGIFRITSILHYTLCFPWKPNSKDKRKTQHYLSCSITFIEPSSHSNQNWTFFHHFFVLAYNSLLPYSKSSYKCTKGNRRRKKLSKYFV